MRSIRTLMFVMTLGTLATPAFAADGVLEINQTCATRTGCLPGDTPGFPVTISKEGSYRLTSNLLISGVSFQLPSVTSVDAIVVTTDGVSIDLGGFSIRCEVDAQPCSTIAQAEGDGIESSATATHVKNGVLQDMGRNGLALGDEALVEDVRAIHNGRHGVQAGKHSVIRSSIASENTETGLYASIGSSISESTAGRNRDGISTGSGSVVSGNAASENSRVGIGVGFGSSVIGNSVAFNGGDGISAAQGVLVQGNGVGNNGFDTNGFGLTTLDATTSYRENVFTANRDSINGGTDTGANLVTPFIP